MMMLHLFGKINNNNSYVRTTTKKAAAVATTIFTLATIIAAVSSSMMVTTTSATEATTGAGGGGEGTPTTTTTPAAAPPPPSSSTYSKLDSTAPSLNVPNDMVLQTGFGGNILLYSVTAQDNRDGNATLDENNQLIQGDNVGGSITIKCNPSSQNLLPVGNHRVRCDANDYYGNYKEAYFIVTVRDPTSPAPTDTIAPNLAVPNGLVITTETIPPPVIFQLAATDNVDGTATLDRSNLLTQDTVGGSITMACDPPSYSRLPVGDNTVTCSAVDAVGNRGTASFTVSVVRTAPEDTIAPVIEVNFLPTRSPAGATTYTVVATDNVDGTATLGEYDTYPPTQDNVGGYIYLECFPSSGSVFSAGDDLSCGSYDSSGNAVITRFTVPTAGVPQVTTLNATTLGNVPGTPEGGDTTPPTVTVPNNMEVEATTTDPTGGTSVTYNNVRAVDNVDGEAVLEESGIIRQDNVGGDITIACDPPSGSSFPVGVTTTVQCNAYDAAGNVGTASFTVTVTSTTPQTLQAEEPVPVEEEAGEEEEEQQPPAAEEAPVEEEEQQPPAEEEEQQPPAATEEEGEGGGG